MYARVVGHHSISRSSRHPGQQGDGAEGVTVVPSALRGCVAADSSCRRLPARLAPTRLLKPSFPEKGLFVGRERKRLSADETRDLEIVANLDHERPLSPGHCPAGLAPPGRFPRPTTDARKEGLFTRRHGELAGAIEARPREGMIEGADHLNRQSLRGCNQGLGRSSGSSPMRRHRDRSSGFGRGCVHHCRSRCHHRAIMRSPSRSRTGSSNAPARLHLRPWPRD